MIARPVGVLARTRWTGIGAIAAILVGAGGLLTASAGSPAVAASFVPITPCRLLDTRPATLVGTRNTPLGNAQTFATAAWGTNGACTIPTGATALSLNVVAVNGTSASYLTVFPADAPLPLSSNLNWTAGAPPTPNAVTVSLAADGRVSFYNNSGNVDLAVDIVGYYVAAAAGPAGPQGPAGPPGPQGVPGAAAPRPAQVIVVAKSGGDFTSVGAAMASITDNSLFKPYLIRVGPGIYSENAGVELKDYVDIEGSGLDVTTLLCGSCGAENPNTDKNVALMRASVPSLHAEVRDLTVAVVDSGSTYQAAIWVAQSPQSPDALRLRNVGVSAVAGANRYAYGLEVQSGLVTADGLVASVTGAGTAVGVLAANASSNVVVRDSSLRGSTSMSNIGAQAYAFDTVFNGNTAGMSGRCSGALYTTLTPYACL